jgi:hypothetical protein
MSITCANSYTNYIVIVKRSRIATMTAPDKEIDAIPVAS